MENTNAPEGTTPSESTEDQVQLSPVEQEALNSGWVPKEEFNGDEHKWVDAAEYLRRGELFRKIDLQGREVKDLRRALVEMKKLHASVRDVEYQRALDTLKAQKKSALEEGDADAVVAADERIMLVREQQLIAASEPVDLSEESGANHPEFVQWASRNNWYTSNAPMRAFADALGMELQSQGLTPPQVLKKVEEEVKKEFPTKFQNQRQSRPNPVEGGTPRGSSSSSFQLTPEERKVMNTFVRQNVMTEKEYIAELKRVKGN